MLATYDRTDAKEPARLDDYVDSLPATGRSLGLEYAIEEGMAIMEGDILLGSVDANGNLARRATTRGLGLEDPFSRWPDGIVPFTPPDENSAIQQISIYLAIDHWMERTSITFVERTEENASDYPNYLWFADTNSCASFVGMQGGKQPVMVADACSVGSIIHELGHALGLFHEHTRPDRDNFITVDWAQIMDGRDINFKIQDVGTTDYGPYDYGSIMHYGEHFFSRGTLPTIIVPDGIEIGQRDALSEVDIKSINDMYATDLALLPPSDTGDENGLEFGITVFNQGELGAHGLQLVASIADDTQWSGVSEGSGWTCQSEESELYCTRPTLTEGRESRFSIFAEPGSGSADDLQLLLTSRTLDTDPSNNRFNNDGTQTVAPETTLAAAVPEQPSNKKEDTDTTVEPNTAAALPTIYAATGTGGSTNASGGAVNGALLLALLGLIGWRYRSPV